MKMLFPLVFILIFPAVTYSQPLIVFEKERHGFGTVSQGDIIEHTFIFTNAGDEDLIIEKLIHS